MAKPPPKKAARDDVKVIVDELLAQFGFSEEVSSAPELTKNVPKTKPSWVEGKKKPRASR